MKKKCIVYIVVYIVIFIIALLLSLAVLFEPNIPALLLISVLISACFGSLVNLIIFLIRKGIAKKV